MTSARNSLKFQTDANTGKVWRVSCTTHVYSEHLVVKYCNKEACYSDPYSSSYKYNITMATAK